MPNKFLKRILPILTRSPSDPSSTKTTSVQNSPETSSEASRSKVSLTSKLRKSQSSRNIAYQEDDIPPIPLPSPLVESPAINTIPVAKLSPETPPTPPISNHSREQKEIEQPILTLERPTPESHEATVSIAKPGTLDGGPESIAFAEALKESLARIEDPSPKTELKSESKDYFGHQAVMPAAALPKRVWVKRQGASATLVQLGEDDLVDDVREKILRKYGNSLGRSFDSPDITLRIIPRADSHGHHERSLGPEESVASTLSQYYPAGQTIDEALIIDIPHRKTPRHSPRIYMDHHRPSENAGDYFSVMPVALNHSPHFNTATTIPTLAQQPLHAISVLNTGQLPNVPLPSPGATSRRHGTHRPKYGRTTTSSPTVITTNVSHAGSLSDRIPGTPAIPALPTPPINTIIPPKISTPPPRTASPRLTKAAKPKKPKKAASGAASTSLLDGGVPPISVLIVEDNMINLRLLEAFMKRLKVRWQTAMNGRDAVVKWRTGGFHLVLMDIQLPIMSGLEATREIRRLEKVNGIGVLSTKVGSVAGTDDIAKPQGDDELHNIDQFKSPVIVVALTASSLQSDRHEALAAGCNDFLTKPVNFVWLERKVMEWGCMQALIDFDGWRKWKDFAQNTPAAAAKPAKAASINSTASNLKPGRVGQESHSDSTGDTDTPPPTTARPAIPSTLVALNSDIQSGDTIGSMDSMNSNDSIDAADERSLPTLSTFEDRSNTPIATALPARSTTSQPSSAQSGNGSGSKHPQSAIRTTAGGSPPTNYGNDRRRKRTSIGRSGLSGVIEELEGVGAS